MELLKIADSDICCFAIRYKEGPRKYPVTIDVCRKHMNLSLEEVGKIIVVLAKVLVDESICNPNA